MAAESPSNIKYIGFWLRTLAVLIDSFVILLLLIPVLFFLLNDPLGTSPAGLATQTLLPAIAFIIFWQTKSATPGKMLINGVIVDATTLGKPSIKQWLIRYLGYYVSTLPLCLGFIWAAFDKRKQGWHDKMANTLVIAKLPDQNPTKGSSQSPSSPPQK